MKSTWALFLFCFCYFAFGMPVMICTISHNKGVEVPPILYFVSYCLYWSQYSLNFFIYAARNVQYRKAYKAFLLKVRLIVNKYESKFHSNLFIRQIMKIVRSPSNMVSIEMNTVYIIQNHQSSIKNYVSQAMDNLKNSSRRRMKTF